jgi:hypothetical protein
MRVSKCSIEIYRVVQVLGSVVQRDERGKNYFWVELDNCNFDCRLRRHLWGKPLVS